MTIKILINMDGGVIQNIYANEDVEIYVADHDIEGTENNHPHLTEFDGDECLLFRYYPDLDPGPVSLAAKTWETT